MLMARVGRWCLGLCAEMECGLWEAHPESSGDAEGRPNSLPSETASLSESVHGKGQWWRSTGIGLSRGGVSEVLKCTSELKWLFLNREVLEKRSRVTLSLAQSRIVTGWNTSTGC